MSPPSGERWFHTLVVVGASLGGCGGKTVADQPRPESTATAGGTGSSGSAGSGGGGISSPDMCAFVGQFMCDDYPTKKNCRCDPEAPADAGACQNPFQYSCVSVPCQATATQLCLGETYVGCHCEPTALTPADCPTPEQFFCDKVSPFFANCACQSPAVDLTSCHSYCCQSNNPRFGCACCPTMIR
ncbi:MAG TPA: hypothetical protein VNG33_24280 [Polyangiaceae bacterium]|nr:hypothetical protein [Polyangiaceae bacterium]